MGSYVLAMTFIILSPTYSLFATNILKLYLVIYAPAWLHGMLLVLLNQFLACSAGARILPGKHSVAFILFQLGGVLVSRTSVYTFVPSLTGIASCAYLHCYHAEDIPSCLLPLTDKEFCTLQFHISIKNKKKKIIAGFTRQVQRHIHNPVKHLR